MNVRIVSACFCLDYICFIRRIPRGNHGLYDYTDTDIDRCLSDVTPDICRAVITGPSHRRGARDGVRRGVMAETGLGGMARLGDGS